MQVNVSGKTVTPERACRIAEQSLVSNGIMGRLFSRRAVVEASPDQVETVYFPYYLGATESRVAQPGSKGVVRYLLIGMEGYTGEMGACVSMPKFEEEVIDPTRAIAPTVPHEEAGERITAYVEETVTRRYRCLYQTKLLQLDTVYRPTYLVPLEFYAGRQQRRALRFIDAESGTIVYRYDVVFRTILDEIRAGFCPACVNH